MTELTKNNPLFGTAKRPRVSIFRSNNAVYVQVIDDETGHTLVASSTKSIKEKIKPVEKAKALGITIAKSAKEAKIAELVFDRNGYRYHGRVKAVADGIREGGIKL